MPQDSRPDPALAETDPAEYKRQAREWRQNIAARQKYVESQLKMGASLSDLGITQEHEHGQAAYNKYMGLYSNYGNVNPGWRYDWVNGVKYNIGTSDTAAHSIPVPITAQEQQEERNQEQFGTYPGSYIDRMQADQRGWMERAAAEGQVTKDPRYPNYYWDGQNKYFDRFGAVVNPQTGQRIGGAYGEDDWSPGSNASGLQYGFSGSGGSSGGGYGGGSGAGGYGSGGSSGAGGLGSLSSNGLLLGSSALEGLAANEGAISAELAKQGRLDTLGKLFEYTRAANQYNQALPQQKYLRDFYGSILGVKFNPGSSQGINNYFNQGVNQTGYQGSIPGSVYSPNGFPTAQPLGNGYFRDPNGQIYYDPNANAQVSGGGRVGGSIPGGSPGPTPASPISNQMPPVQGGGGGGATGGAHGGGRGDTPQSPIAGPSLMSTPDLVSSTSAPGLLGPPQQAGPGKDEYARSQDPPPPPPLPLPWTSQGQRGDKPGRIDPPMQESGGAGYLGPPVTGGKGDNGFWVGPPQKEKPGTKEDGYLGPPLPPGPKGGGDGVPINQGHGGGWIHGNDPRNWGGAGSWDGPGRVNVGAQYVPGQMPPVVGTPGFGDTTQVPPVTPPDQMPPTLSGLMKKNGGNLPRNPGDNDFPPRETSFMTPGMNGRSEGWAGQGGNFMTPAGGPSGPPTQAGGPSLSGTGSVGAPGVVAGDPGVSQSGAPRGADQMISPDGPNQASTGGGPGQGGDGTATGGGGQQEPVPPALWYAWIPYLRAHPGATFSDFLADPAQGPVLERWIRDQQYGGQSPNGYAEGQQQWFEQQPGYHPGAEVGWQGGNPNLQGQNPANWNQSQWYRPISPDLPNAPAYDEGSYELTGNSYNPMDSSTWGFLAKGAGQIAGDADRAAEQIRQTLPAGGARDKALAQLAQGKFAGVAGLRQDLTNSALSGISGLTETGLGYSPGSLTGGASTLGNIFSNKYSTDVGAQTSANNLAENSRQFNANLQQQNTNSKRGLFGSLGSTLGSIFGSGLSKAIFGA